MAQTEQFSRWRLILGSETQQSFNGMGAGALSQEELLMDGALSAIYGGPDGEGPLLPRHFQMAGRPSQPVRPGDRGGGTK